MKLPSWAGPLFNNAQKHAARRGLDFDLSKEDLAYLVQRADGACEVSGIKFGLLFSTGQAAFRRRPWAPSLDRVDSAKGYSRDNCRLVCCAANLAMNEWGEEVLKTLARAVTWREFSQNSRRIFTAPGASGRKSLKQQQQMVGRE